ncbi:hypothetical protein BHE90_006059 [Fusarium euwallaceae]|uniref:Uncharacterized protein n=1 Tax=Fusarium euwallaceae TaxID=1147111 RepID=A0A430LUS3_9HYPO|nr:hypothetical protein BHE90_006059 [Fusarium euwallaceae]
MQPPTTHWMFLSSRDGGQFALIRRSSCTKRRTSNRIFSMVRAGGPRTAESFDELAQQLEAAWDAVINGGKRGHGDKEMKVVSIQGSIPAGVESGLLLPRAGGDAAWLNENKPMFERLAQAGDADFVQLLDEMQNREDLVKALSGQ